MNYPFVLFVFMSALGSVAAAEMCDVPVADWQPREILKSKLEAEGWKVRSIVAEDGCYEAYATDGSGNAIAAAFNPKTLIQVGVAQATDKNPSATPKSRNPHRI